MSPIPPFQYSCLVAAIPRLHGLPYSPEHSPSKGSYPSQRTVRIGMSERSSAHPTGQALPSAMPVSRYARVLPCLTSRSALFQATVTSSSTHAWPGTTFPVWRSQSLPPPHSTAIVRYRCGTGTQTAKTMSVSYMSGNCPLSYFTSLLSHGKDAFAWLVAQRSTGSRMVVSQPFLRSQSKPLSFSVFAALILLLKCDY
jgi:hypothetical protein